MNTFKTFSIYEGDVIFCGMFLNLFDQNNQKH